MASKVTVAGHIAPHCRGGGGGDRRRMEKEIRDKEKNAAIFNFFDAIRKLPCNISSDGGIVEIRIFCQNPN